MVFQTLNTVLAVVATLFVTRADSDPIRLLDHHARQFFSLAPHEKVPFHEVVIPWRAHPDTGKFLTHNIQHHHHSRGSRDTSDVYLEEGQPLDYTVEAFGEVFQLHLENANFVRPDFATTTLNEEGPDEMLHGATPCHWQGTVKSHNDSPVAISNCDGLRGGLYTNNTRMVIEPLSATMRVSEYGPTGQPHVIYVPSEDRNETHCLVKAEGQDVDLPEEFERTVLREMQRNQTEKTAHSRQRRSVRKYTVEALIVVDQQMVRRRNFQSAAQARDYALALSNLASLHFRREFLGVDLSFVVVRVVVLNRTEPGLHLTHHSTRALNTFCQWQDRTPWLQKRYDRDPEFYDVAILLTGLELCPYRNQGCGELGRAYVGGACKRRRKCSVNFDAGMTTGFVIAHETGHNLNLTHDGQSRGNRCPEAGGNLMAATISGRANLYRWSSCSQRELRKFVNSIYSSCLRDSPAINLSKPFDKVGERYTPDQQCKLWLGPRSQQCPHDYAKESLCSQLWCTIPGRYGLCRTANTPPAPGTSCGSNQVCLNGRCVTDGQRQTLLRTNVHRPAGRDPQRVVQPPRGRAVPQWGQWKQHGPCSRTCGGGVRYYIRRCFLRGVHQQTSKCSGSWIRYKLCNTQDCRRSLSSNYLIDQCNSVARRLNRADRTTWIPGYKSAMKCRLVCRSSTNKTVNYPAQDGTPCSYYLNNRCVGGQCRPFGCDNQHRSSAKWDKCGICNGDSSRCKSFRGHKAVPSSGTGSMVMIRLPRGSRSVNIKGVFTQQRMHVEIQTIQGLPIVNGLQLAKQRHRTVQFYAAGTEFTYKRSAGTRPDVILSAIKELAEDLIVKITYSNPGRQRNFQWRFYFNPNHYDNAYRLKTISTACSVTCGNGVFARKNACVDVRTGRQVNFGFCVTLAQTRSSKQLPCHQRPCPAQELPKWHTRNWRACSASCGLGWQTRAVPCRLRGTSVHKSRCTAPRPNTRQQCHIKACPQKINGDWSKFSPWSKCSRTCGGGMQYRRRFCTNPAPQNGGRNCQGPHLLGRICRAMDCPLESLDFRAGQCAQFNNHAFNGKTYHWTPHRKGIETCRLLCQRNNNTKAFVLRPSVVDGTRCHGIYNNRCMFGRCQPTGCDNVLGSSSKIDRCGVCRGNGSQCVDVSRQYSVGHTAGGLYTFAMIEKHARLVNITKPAKAVNSSFIITDTSGRIIMPSPVDNSKKVSEFIASGQMYIEHRRVVGERESIFIGGPVIKNIIIKLNVSNGGQKNPSIRYEYTINKRVHKPQPPVIEYAWSLIPSGCSVTCGQGFMKLLPRCQRSKDTVTVSDRFCKGGKPRVRSSTQSCSTRQACPKTQSHIWVSKLWQACSATCGQGVQKRAVQCVRLPQKSVVALQLCSPVQQPAMSRLCFSQACPAPAKWNTDPWGQCSVSCGTGEQRRRIYCKRSLPLQQCPPGRPITTKSCQMEACPKKRPELEQNDVDESCLDRLDFSICRLVIKYNLCSADDRYRTACCQSCQATNQ